jgi:hypothetical protein
VPAAILPSPPKFRETHGFLPLLLYYDASSKAILPVEKSHCVSATRHSKMDEFPSFSDDDEWGGIVLQITAQRALELAQPEEKEGMENWGWGMEDGGGKAYEFGVDDRLLQLNVFPSSSAVNK